MKTGVTQKVKAEYNQLASKYDERWRGYLNNTHRKAMRLIKSPSGKKILDVSGGTGEFARRLLTQHDCNLTITDFSPQMLQKAEEKLRPFDSVSINLVDAQRLPYPDEHFDIVICLSAVHFYANPTRSIGEMVRVLKHDGQLLVLDWCADPLYFRLIRKGMQVARYPMKKVYKYQELRQLLTMSGVTVYREQMWNYRMWPLMIFDTRKER